MNTNSPPAPLGPNDSHQPDGPTHSMAAPPRKSWFARHKILTGLLALVLLGSAGSALGSGGDAPSVGAPTSEVASAQPKAEDSDAAQPKVEDAVPDEPKADDAGAAKAKIGTAVRDGQFEFTVTKVEKNVASVGSEYLNEKAQGTYVIVHVTVKNIGEKAQLFSDSSQKVLDGSGREFSTDTAAGIYIEDNKVFFNDINPGNSVKGKLVFDMPKGASPATVELHDSPFSDGVTVALS